MFPAFTSNCTDLQLKHALLVQACMNENTEEEKKESVQNEKKTRTEKAQHGCLAGQTYAKQTHRDLEQTEEQTSKPQKQAMNMR